ncbi:glycoside hydrolase family 28 protein [Sphingobacterium deserti]|uniref:Glycoside hydrolase family 28 n=1 Tax=Sphingobacterium deserti TaxID=1229276 RepID=A0A0B8T4R8_9SPHI|nr:glycoside hydrolase family 28 protein [Sphingobacterium deserti]KGE15153.1 glycoside hydrolase family 28 [Sphingobacterium deserti]
MMKKIIGSILICLAISYSMAQETTWTAASQPLAEIEALKKQIVAPTFRSKDYAITNYGAKGDGVTKNTEAIRKAIEQCNKDGGGRVVVPNGIFLTGAIYLKSNVNLHIQEGATILFSRDSSDYPMVFTRWEGMECMNFSPFIYAYGEENIAITGKGLLDGNSDNDHWWYWCGARKYGWDESKPGEQKPARALLHQQMAEEMDSRKRIYGDGHFLRPNFVQPYQCKNVWIADVKMINSPMWNLNPVLCENVLIERVKIVSHGPNNDGCDPEACKNVWIKDCYFDTGDDCIAIKSGRDEDGRNIGRPAENHIIENCMMKDGHGGVVIGSEIAGGARNIYALNNVMDSPNLDRALRIKTSSSRGGTIENVFFYNTEVGQYKEAAVRFNMFYEKPGKHIPTIRNIWVENLEVKGGGKYAVLSSAYESSPVTNFTMINCKIDGVQEPYKVDHLKQVTLKNVVINGKPISSFD